MVETAAEEEKSTSKQPGITAGIFPETGLQRRFGRRGRRAVLYPSSRLSQHDFGGVLAPSILNWRRY